MSYKILLHPDAWDYFWTCVDLMPGEIGAFGYAEIDTERQEVYVPEVFLVPQESDKHQVDFVEHGLPYAIEKAATEGKLDQLRFCIHSHGPHGAFWSTTDEDMIEKMGLTSDWFVSAIFNRKHEVAGRIDVFDLPPLGKVHVKMKDLAVEMYRSDEYLDRIITDIEELVRKPKPQPQQQAKPQPNPQQKSLPPGGPMKVTPEQIREAVREALGGDDRDDDRLPTMQDLADELGWEPFVADGIRYWCDPQADYEVMHMEAVSDDGFDKMLSEATGSEQA